MPQESVLYAVGRLRMLRRHLLTPAQKQRLIAAQDATEAQKLLLEYGYITSEQPDVEQASVDRLLAASRMVQRLTPDPATTDSFLLRNDVHNLKTLLKARILREEPEGLSAGGTLDVEALRHAVAEHSYGRLPVPLKETMELLEKRIAITVDPMEIDVRLDQAMYRMMAEGLKHSRSPAARKWLAAKADFVNLRSYLRLKNMQAPLELKDVLVEGGDFYKAFQRGHETGDQIVRRVSAVYSQQITQTAVRALEDRAQIGTLERQMEGYLRQLFEKERMKPDSIDAVIDYLLSVEEESADVRLIMAGKRNGLSPEDIQARLRRGYGR